MFWDRWFNDLRLVDSFFPFSFNKKTIFLSKFEVFSSELNDELLDGVGSNKELVFTRYDDVMKTWDEVLYKDFDFRSSLFVIESGFLGREFFKSSSFSVNSGVVFEVLSGEGFVLMGSLDGVKNVKVVSVKVGSFIIVPKGYGFVLINSSNMVEFVLHCVYDRDSEFVSRVFESVSGGSLYYTKNGFVRNKNVDPSFILEEYEGEFVLDEVFDLDIGLYREAKVLPDKFTRLF